MEELIQTSAVVAVLLVGLLLVRRLIEREERRLESERERRALVRPSVRRQETEQDLLLELARRLSRTEVAFLEEIEDESVRRRLGPARSPETFVELLREPRTESR